MTHEGLLPRRHPSRDFFICDLLDVIPKDDLGSMEHPLFSLSTKPDHRIRRYEHNGNRLTIAPGAYGLATIWDKDILIYCISQLMEGLNRGREVRRTVRVTAYDLLVSTNRGTGGDHYKRLHAALERLAGTRISTDIRTNGVRIKEGFGLIDRYRIVERSPLDERMIALEITLSEWFYNAILGREVLSISRDYFRLRKGIERRLYELARKHCGHQSKWKINLDLLHKKSGSSSALREFRRIVKIIVNSQHLPDYRLSYSEKHDSVTFYPKDSRGNQAQVQDLLDGL
jgi:plasmid replication initiation protein